MSDAIRQGNSSLRTAHRFGTVSLQDGSDVGRGVEVRPRHTAGRRYLPALSAHVNEQAERFLHPAAIRRCRRVSASGEIVDTIVQRLSAIWPTMRSTGKRSQQRIRHDAPAPLVHLPYEESWLPVVATGRRVGCRVFIGEVRSGDLKQPHFRPAQASHRGRYPAAQGRAIRAAAVDQGRTDVDAGTISTLQRGPETSPRERLRPPWSIQDGERRRRIAQRSDHLVPETHPPVRRVLAGRDGSIWLLREAWPNTPPTCGRSTTRMATWREACESMTRPPGTRAFGHASSRQARTELWVQTRSELDPAARCPLPGARSLWRRV